MAEAVRLRCAARREWLDLRAGRAGADSARAVDLDFRTGLLEDRAKAIADARVMA
jgi:hypothetical protein